ncbi:hypothetical protein L596_015393 [Steinernema carpocapsae]|uniref:Tripeptidyl-peptidase 2 n=1 Tax=Steinernema carpocapsae TaxID=34508 RepID=A0A4U5NEV1_STECR|nr:hypothetical protein L596_015393 [Steinernema carpocapsae]
MVCFLTILEARVSWNLFSVRKDAYRARMEGATPTMSASSSNSVLQPVLEAEMDFEFPLKHLLPKNDTQIEGFLKKHPEYDGRGVRIAILDTGVDPAIPTLSTTTTGEPKFIDVMDLTGAGDVVTTTIRKPDEKGYITGLTGRKMKIPENWVNPTKEFRVGMKPIFELYSKSLQNRVKKERREEYWETDHRLSSADARRLLDKHETDIGGQSDQIKDKYDRENLACMVDYLKQAEKFEDVGPISDCLVWNDGKKWVACVDTSFRGKLGQCKVMSNFRESFEYDSFSTKDMLTYAVTIHNNGNLLEIIACSMSHGSHVANIAAGHCPEDPSRNGLAPGARIVSMCIGDLRLNAMETGTALMRAFQKCVDLKVDIVNYSFGEATHLPNQGRIIEELAKMVNRHGIIFMSSAGNNGPALSTVGAPGATSSVSIGVGAYVSEAMMETMYSLRDKIPDTLYPWSSRGPAQDGSLGVSICAPGAAITGVPRSNLTGTQLMNGTSMSSPNATGSTACLLSAMKQNDLPISPYSVRAALENTAIPTRTGDTFVMGQGLVQIESAFEYLKSDNARSGFTPELYGFKVEVAPNGNRGIYLREFFETRKPQDFAITVEPMFMECPDLKKECKLDFERHFLLECNADFVESPKCLELGAHSRSFSVRVDPTKLTPGQAYYTEIRGIDARRKNLGPLFRVPITVITPLTVDASTDYTLTGKKTMEPSHPERTFVKIPEGATYAEVKLKSNDAQDKTRYIAHMVQLLPNLAYRNTEKHTVVELEPRAEKSIFLKVFSGRTLELCLTKWWQNLGKAELEWSVAFRGAHPLDNHMTILSTSPIWRFDVENSLDRYEEITPAITLKELAIPLKPQDVKLIPMGPRDTMINATIIWELLLNYNFTVGEKKTVDCLFELPSLSTMLYENPIDNILIMVYSKDKKYMGTASSYPQRYIMKLPKGDYVAKVQIRSHSDVILERFRDISLIFRQRINQVSLSCYANPAGAITGVGTKKITGKGIRCGERIPVYVTPLSDDKVPKQVVAGAYLSGHLTLANADQENVKKTALFPVTYVFPEWGKRQSKALSKVELVAPKSDDRARSATPPPNSEEAMNETIRDVKIGFLSKLTDEVAADRVWSELYESYPNHIPLLTAQLVRLSKAGISKPGHVDAMEGLVEHILGVCEPTEVLIYQGTKQENNDDPKLKQDMDQRKNAIINALATRVEYLGDSVLRMSKEVIPTMLRKGLNITESGLVVVESSASMDKKPSVGDFQIVGEQDQSAATPSAQSEPADAEVPDQQLPEQSTVTRQQFDDAYNELLKWVDPHEKPRFSLLTAKHAMAHGHNGRAAKALQKCIDDRNGMSGGAPLETVLAEVLRCVRSAPKFYTKEMVLVNVGCDYIARNMRNASILKYPSDFQPF